MFFHPIENSISRRVLTLFLIFTLVLPTQSLRAMVCEEAVLRIETESYQSFAQGIGRELGKECQGRVCSRSEVTRAVHSKLEQVIQKLGLSGSQLRKARSYAIIISAMVATAATTAVVTSYFSNNYPSMGLFLSVFISQLTALGFYQAGAPLLEPLTGYIRRVFFEVETNQNQKPAHPWFMEQFRSTNSGLTAPEQYGRNFLRFAREAAFFNADRARQSLDSGRPELAVNYIAELALTFRQVFPDVNPTQQVIVSRIHLLLTDVIANPQRLVEPTLEILRREDPAFDHTATIKVWLRDQ